MTLGVMRSLKRSTTEALEGQQPAPAADHHPPGSLRRRVTCRMKAHGACLDLMVTHTERPVDRLEDGRL